jgi:hypothetical protein
MLPLTDPTARARIWDAATGNELSKTGGVDDLDQDSCSPVIGCRPLSAPSAR